MANPISNPDLCVVMPAYNEEGCMRKVVEGWLAELDTYSGLKTALVVVNDGSRDRTGAILDEMAGSLPRLVVVHQANGGHGRALLTAYRKAAEIEARWVFQVDSDDQFACSDMKLLWAEREKSLFITGYRLERHDPLVRLVITRILRLLLLLLYGRYIPDSNIPFRLIEGRYLRALLEVLPDSVFAPNIFLAVLAKRDGQDLRQIPVEHKERQTGKISIVKLSLLKACWRSAKELYHFRSTLRERLARLKELKGKAGI